MIGHDMNNFEDITPAECRPLARRLITLSVHAERIQWPKGIVDDLRNAALVLEITAERAEGIDQEAVRRRVVANSSYDIPTRMNDPAAHVDPFSTPRARVQGDSRPQAGVEAILSDDAWGRENDATKDYS